MTKITDSYYYLPVIQAHRASDELKSGTTIPMLVSGFDSKTFKEGQYVVKYMAAPRMDQNAACRELIAAWIGMEIGLNVAEPVAIEITSEFVETLLGRSGYENAVKSVGLNFGTVFKQGFIAFLPQTLRWNDFLFEQASDVFGFDLFISNTDRGHIKPNIMTNGSEFFLFDHELAFSFLMLLSFAKSTTPWIIGETEKDLYTNHFFFSYLKENKYNFENIIERLALIDNNFWEKVEVLIPKPWRTNQVKEIRDYLSGIVENRVVFQESLSNILQ